MNAFEEHEIAAYVLGDAPAELASRIRAAAATDEQFAAELDSLASLGNSFELLDDLAPRPAALRRHSRLFLRRAALAASILVATAGVAWGSYELLHTPPLLKDDFSTRTVSYSVWHPHLGRRGVSATNGYLQLLNRGSVVTQREFDEPIEIEFDWRWIDHGNWPLYSENFTVCIRTKGEHKAKHAYEMLDGLNIVFVTMRNHVVAGRGEVVLASAPPDSLPMPSGEWHHVRIVDDGTNLSIYVTGPIIDPRLKKKPALQVAIPAGLVGRHVAFFNREYVGDINHESHVDNIRIRRFEK